MSSGEEFIQRLILGIHHRNGGELNEVDFSRPLLDRSFRMDSLDLAEIMAAVEKEYGRSPFDAPEPPRSWREIAEFLDGAKRV